MADYQTSVTNQTLKESVENNTELSEHKTRGQAMITLHAREGGEKGTSVFQKHCVYKRQKLLALTILSSFSFDSKRPCRYMSGV